MNSAEVIYVEVDGHSVACRKAGHGAPLVLLHGFFCDSQFGNIPGLPLTRVPPHGYVAR